MHGLINKSLQSFFCATYGTARWSRVTEAAGFDSPDFEAMLIYDKAQSRRLLDAMALELDRPLNEVLEDIGTFLVSNPQTESLRRLLRFCGESYLDFLHSLDDLPDRARLAVSDLHLPALELREHAAGRFSLTCGPGLPGFGNVLVGVLRAMADDYGALAMLEHSGGGSGHDVISITLVEQAFAEGRRFELGAAAQ
ncbi:heme NO-binding domain-containing protein [Sedimentitalea sp. XS_ASV28]|uniref:heme NO-binding domain-containing protein n=1 Tax=Sedimentitalea sp. XS_ASV28 TaxID=3241296 RepID=UPI003518A869